MLAQTNQALVRQDRPLNTSLDYLLASRSRDRGSRGLRRYGSRTPRLAPPWFYVASRPYFDRTTSLERDEPAKSRSSGRWSPILRTGLPTSVGYPCRYGQLDVLRYGNLFGLWASTRGSSTISACSSSVCNRPVATFCIWISAQRSSAACRRQPRYAPDFTGRYKTAERACRAATEAIGAAVQS